MGLFSIFKKGLQKTAVSVSRTISGLFTGEKKWDSEAFEELEFSLVAADFGVKAAGEIAKELKEAYDLGKISTSADIYSEATKLVTEILCKNPKTEENGSKQKRMRCPISNFCRRINYLQ